MCNNLSVKFWDFPEKNKKLVSGVVWCGVVWCGVVCDFIRHSEFVKHVSSFTAINLSVFGGESSSTFFPSFTAQKNYPRQ